MDNFTELMAAINETCCPKSQKQAEAQNYKKGRLALHGFKIVVENPRSTMRTKLNEQGEIKWQNLMKATYGYFSGTLGKDGDEVDVFIGDYPESEDVWVINQVSKDGELDEHKVMMGFMDQESAIMAYNNSYDFGWDGLGSIVHCTIEQLRFWLKNTDKQRPFSKDLLPYDAGVDMTEFNVDGVYEQIVNEDLDGFSLDAATTQDIMDDLEDGTEIIALDALVTEYKMLDRKMKIMFGILKAASGEQVKPIAYQITEPYRQRGTTNVAAVFEFSDGQTVSVFFHNPDITPKKIMPTDELISWKWVLNKKDVTILVAPERGKDLNVREVARRMTKLVEKNSERFQRANEKKAERMAVIETKKTTITQKESQLAELNQEISQLEAAKDKPATPELTIEAATTPEGYARISKSQALKEDFQDVLDSFFQQRIIDVRNALRELGWEGEQFGDLTKAGFTAIFDFEQVGGGANIVGYSVNGIRDDLTQTPQEIANMVNQDIPEQEEDSTGFSVGDPAYSYMPTLGTYEAFNYRGISNEDSSKAVVVRDGLQINLPVSGLVKESEAMAINEDISFINSVSDGNADLYDTEVTKKLADLAVKYSTNEPLTEKLSAAKKALKDFFLAEFQRKAG